MTGPVAPLRSRSGLREKRLGMSEQLHEAAERARLERRRRLVTEVAPYLAPGERVLEATTGRGTIHGPGERPRDSAVLRVVVTDQRLILLRKKAFRQFAVQEFDFDTSRVWLGFTAEAGGELEVGDTAHRTHASLSGVPELDLEPVYLALRERMQAEQLDVWLDPPQSEGPSIVLTDVDDLVDLDEAAALEPVIDVPEPEPVRVGGSSIEEILVAAGFPPESVEGPVPSVQFGRAGAGGVGTPGSEGGGAFSGSPAMSGPPPEPFIDRRSSSPTPSPRSTAVRRAWPSSPASCGGCWRRPGRRPCCTSTAQPTARSGSRSNRGGWTPASRWRSSAERPKPLPARWGHRTRTTGRW